jgi:hypothetical protein
LIYVKELSSVSFFKFHKKIEGWCMLTEWGKIAALLSARNGRLAQRRKKQSGRGGAEANTGRSWVAEVVHRKDLGCCVRMMISVKNAKHVYGTFTK